VEHYLESGETVNSVWYSEMLSTIMKPAVRNKLRNLSSGVLLHHNARPHTAIHTLQTIVKLGYTVLKHSAVPISHPRTTMFFVHLKMP
jgi:hypothetical protein